MSEYTKGPWEIRHVSDIRMEIFKGPESIADIWALNGGKISHDELIANARLIAAAPELLEDNVFLHDQLIRFLENIYYEQTGQDPKNNGYSYVKIPEWAVRQWIDRLDGTIAKAKGES